MFNVEYDAHEQKWDGVLIITEHNQDSSDPDLEDGVKTFSGKASGVFRLLELLDEEQEGQTPQAGL